MAASGPPATGRSAFFERMSGLKRVGFSIHIDGDLKQHLRKANIIPELSSLPSIGCMFPEMFGVQDAEITIRRELWIDIN